MSKVIKITNFKRLDKGALLGFVSIEMLHNTQEIRDLTVFRKDGRMWFNLPQREYKNKDGETKYYSLVGYSDKGRYEAFMVALHEAFKEYLVEENIDLDSAQDDPRNTYDAPKKVEEDELPF
jgi:hypothetical protein